MTINSRNINYASINGSNIVSYGEGAVVSLDQTVRQYAAGEGSLVSIKQNIKSTGNGAIVTLTQLVKSPYQATFLEKNGWYPSLNINGWIVPDNRIHGNISIKHTENDSSEMNFTILVNAGVQDLGQYEGVSVTCDMSILSTNTTKRVFTGIINIVDIDLIYGKIDFTCSMQRKEKIISDLADVVKNIGYYSNDVFGEAQDLADEADKRLTTVPYALDFDSYGAYHIADLSPKTTADLTFTNSEIYRDNGRDPKVVRPVRTQIVNKVNIEMGYQYTRCYHLQRAFNFPGLTNVSTCEFLQKGYTVPTRELVRAAIDAAGWPLRGSISYTPVLDGGFYNCSGSTIGWTTSKVNGTYTVKKDVNGNLVLDAQGEKMYTFTQTGYQDAASSLCFGAAWQATTRFAQNVIENYTLTVAAPQSQAQYGVIEQTDRVSVTSEYDASEWENYKAYQQEPAGVTTTPAQPAVNYFFNKDTNRTSFENTSLAIINKAKTTILKSHRQHKIIFNKFIDPRVELWHTVYLDTDIINAKGKVYSITHDINISEGSANTEVEMVLSKANGSTSVDVLAVPSRVSDSPITEGPGVTLQSHWGEDPSSTAALRWNGYIGNKWVTNYVSMYNVDTYLTTFPISFRVDVPAIPTELRSNRTLTTVQNYNIEIPNNTLTITSR